MGSLPDLAAFLLRMDSCRGYFFFILSHRNDLESLNSEHRRRSTDATQSDAAVSTYFYVEAVLDNMREGKGVVFSNIGQAISGNTLP